MSKPPDSAEALLLRIHTMKWQAVSVLSSSRDGLVREEAAALIATLDGIASAVLNDPAPESIKSALARLDTVAILRDHAPLRRSSGRS